MATIGSSDTPVITPSYTEEFNSKLDRASVSNDTSLSASSPDLVPTQNAVKSYVDSHTTGVSDASNTVKGVVKLAGDLGGTADLPTVPGLVSKADLVGGKVPLSQLPDAVVSRSLQDVYNVSSNPEIVTDSTRGAVTVKNGGANNTVNVFEVSDLSGTVTASVRGDAVPTVPTDLTTKLYVDGKDSANVKLSGNQSISGTKTFASSPVVPNPTATTHAASLGSVDSLRLGRVSLKNARVRSFSGLGNGSSNTIYVCPASKKAMILGIQLRQVTTGTVSAMLVSSRATFSGFFYLYNQSVTAASTMVDLAFWGIWYSRNFVMEQTESVSLSLSNGSPYVLTVVEFDSTTDITTQIAQFSGMVNNVVLTLPASTNGWYTSCLEDANKQSVLTTQWTSSATVNVAISGIGANIANSQAISAAIVTNITIPHHLPGGATITVTDMAWAAPNDRVVYATFYQS